LTTDVLAKSFGSRSPRLFSDRGVSLFFARTPRSRDHPIVFMQCDGLFHTRTVRPPGALNRCTVVFD
jgi:hypothetical protein